MGKELHYVPQNKWAESVKKSFDNTCCYCGKNTRIEAHHIIPKSINPALENNIENGIALCHECHLKAHGGTFNPFGASMTLSHSQCAPVIDFVSSLRAEMGLSEEDWKKQEE